jgi:hypothetical protein
MRQKNIPSISPEIQLAIVLATPDGGKTPVRGENLWEVFINENGILRYRNPAVGDFGSDGFGGGTRDSLDELLGKTGSLDAFRPHTADFAARVQEANPLKLRWSTAYAIPAHLSPIWSGLVTRC